MEIANNHCLRTRKQWLFLHYYNVDLHQWQTYCSSCSNSRNSFVSKNSTSEMPNPSQIILIVTIPGFRLAPFKMFFTVVGGTPALRASPLIDRFFFLHSSRIRFPTHSTVPILSPLSIYSPIKHSKLSFNMRSIYGLLDLNVLKWSINRPLMWRTEESQGKHCEDNTGIGCFL